MAFFAIFCVLVGYVWFTTYPTIVEGDEIVPAKEFRITYHHLVVITTIK